MGPAPQQLAGVKTTLVETASGTARLRLYGRVTPLETAIHRVYLGVDGYIRETSPVTSGSQVKKGQWLATFATPEARQPVAAYMTTLDVVDREAKLNAPPLQMAAANASLAVAVDRLLTMGMSPLQIEEIRRTRVIPPYVLISAPTDGFVLSRNLSTGEKLDRGTEVFRIADLRRVWILADVAVADRELIAPGTIAHVSVAGSRQPVRARVSRDALPQFDQATQSFRVRLEADNQEFALRPDMFVDVDVEIPYHDALVVPASAIVASGLTTRVFVEHTPGMFMAHDVELGRRFGDRVVVLGGVTAGTRIAVSGTFLLDSESRMNGHDQPHH
jgi:Cu(I)/Ag(I) efflux system membrane fusion protein